ncbi:MAG: ATPase subunit of ABC transporter with duplicated ATPase domains [Saprospiraceae bacterium]|jgi:ATPase subunit of ABC transporter with duplicated ATPase domains
MITTTDIGLQYGKRILFDEVNLKFNQGNCYGVIGANGAGKSTFVKILSGEIEPNYGSFSIEPGKRMAVLKQDHFKYEEIQVLDTVMMGHEIMYKIAQEKNIIYMNPDATDADGLKAAELENLYGEMGGWEAESNAAELLSNMGIAEEHHYKLMKELSNSQKVKVLLAQALFGDPDILLLDEPTNDLDAETATWLSDFLAEFKNLVIVVSHDRYFLDMVCTHMVDIDYNKIKIYTGNYTFWYESSQLMTQQAANKNKKTEQKRKEMMEFIQRFSANASKSRQATSRKKALEKLSIDEIKPSTRKYPFIHFNPERKPGDQILRVDNLSKSRETGELLFSNLSFIMNRGEKIALIARDSSAITAVYDVLAGKQETDTGTIEWGQTITNDYLPNENHEFFSEAQDIELMDWLRQYSSDKDEQFIRGFLGRMLFSGEEVFKKSSVLSGGEKVRCMLSKIMLKNPNFLLLDEPTNHLDLESITALNNALNEFPGNLIMTSHDHQLLDTVCNRVIELTPGGIIDRLMSYDDYIRSEEIKAMRDKMYKKAAAE